MDFEFSGGQNTRKWNSEVINLIFNGLTYSVSANFLNAHIFSVNYIFFANVKLCNSQNICILYYVLNHQV